jgi:hydroxymethylglutaryl-CoA reductase
MIAQVQVVEVPNLELALERLSEAQERLLEEANAVHPNLVRRGGGARSLEVRVLEGELEGEAPMVVLHLIVDCVDAMGANAVNAMAEGIAPHVEALTGGKVYLRILSNLADRRLARASLRVPVSALASPKAGMSGEEVARGVVYAYRFADLDPYRAATHNKGVMNGIDAVALATGNDWRGVEAGAHAYAAQSGRYRSLTRFWIEPSEGSEGEAGEPSLCGSIELPLAVATVGGSTNVHPTIKALRKLLRVESARELAAVMAAVGLSQNLAALKALASEGIQRGHMSLHARQVALNAGATEAEVSEVARALVASGEVKLDAAERLIAELRAGG